MTKSGTNEFHGSALLLPAQQQVGRAATRSQTQTVLVNGAFTPVVPLKPKDVRHQFGGTIGGPIVKDKVFFFFSYDQQNRKFPGLARIGINNFLNLTAANRTTLLARGLTSAQIDNTLNFLNSLTGEIPRRGDQTLFLPKIDWNLNDKNTFTATYNRLRWDSPNGIQTQATNTRARDNFGDDFVDIDWITLRLASTISPTLLNEVRYQYGRDKETQFSRRPCPASQPTLSVAVRRRPF